jgi:hypothetical protein
MERAALMTRRAIRRAGKSLAITYRGFRSAHAACVSGFIVQVPFAPRSGSHSRAVSCPDLTHSPIDTAVCNIVTSVPLATDPSKINRKLSATFCFHFPRAQFSTQTGQAPLLTDARNRSPQASSTFFTHAHFTTPPALTTQHASPTMKMRAKRAASVICNDHGPRVTNH